MNNIHTNELSDAQLDAVVGGGIWGWIKGKAKAAGQAALNAVKKWAAEQLSK